MRPLSRILFGVSLALCWSSIATAGPTGPTQSLDPSRFRAITNMQLDIAFERFVSLKNIQPLYGLTGPSSMDCTNAAMEDGIETCVVTTRGPASSMPAVLARR
jgi:hypothetical protein